MGELSDLSTLSGIPADSFADKVFNRYAQRLLAVARERLGGRLRTKVSEEDVVQSAFKSFFRRRDEFQFADDGSGGLWALLLIITLRKCAKWADVFGTRKRAAQLEVPLADGSNRFQWPEIATREPGPEEAARLSELVQQLMQPFDSRQQQMISLRMQGYEVEEIAREVQSSKRTVNRTIADAKHRLRRMLTKEGQFGGG